MLQEATLFINCPYCISFVETIHNRKLNYSAIRSLAVLRLGGLIYHMPFFFYGSAEKVLSYAHLNCAVFNYFYMSLGQVRHTIVVSRYQNHRKDNEIQL